MSLTKEEVRSLLKDFSKEFKDNFPGEDPTKAVIQHCNAVLLSKMQSILSKRFDFRTPSELISILDYLYHEQAQKEPRERGPGRPRKPRPRNSKV